MEITKKRFNLSTLPPNDPKRTALAKKTVDWVVKKYGEALKKLEVELESPRS